MKFWNWINGNKTLIGSIAMLVINSDYISGMITDPSLYTLLQGIAMAMLAGGLGHKVVKAAKSGK